MKKQNMVYDDPTAVKHGAKLLYKGKYNNDNIADVLSLVKNDHKMLIVNDRYCCRFTLDDSNAKVFSSPAKDASSPAMFQQADVQVIDMKLKDCTPKAGIVFYQHSSDLVDEHHFSVMLSSKTMVNAVSIEVVDDHADLDGQ